jgi:membrane protease YdiL (CAAX protease family)
MTSQQGHERSPVLEAFGAFAVVTAIVSLLYRLRAIPFIERNLAVIAAVMFLYLPATLLFRRGRDLEQYGLRAAPLGRGLGLYALAVACVLPPFAVAYGLYIHSACPPFALYLAQSARHLHWYCPQRLAPELRLPSDFLMTAVSQLFVVALPEEFFFRGFLFGRLSEAMRPRWALLLSALLFALGHYLVTFDPGALAVFFPGLLFGFLRMWTGSVLAGTFFHATCNLLIETLHRSIG